MKNTLWILTFLLAPLAPLRGQSEELQRAILIEEQEHDAAQAAKLYAQIAESETTPAADRTMAWYRLGRVLQRLGKPDEAHKALTAAAAGIGPAAAAAKKLLAAGGQDAERWRKLRAQAKDLLVEAPSGLGRKLAWIGPAAVPEIVAAKEPAWRSGAAPLADVVWRIGGEFAHSFLARVLARPAGPYKTALSRSIPHDFDPAMLDLVLQVMEDESLAPEINLNAARYAVQRAPLDRLLALTRSPRPEVAAGIWALLGQRLGAKADGRELDKILPALKAALERRDFAVATAADNFLRSQGARTRAGLELMLERIEGWPRVMNISGVIGGYPSPAAIFLPAARALGPYVSDDRRSVWLAAQVHAAFRTWGREEDARAALELVRLSYQPDYPEWTNALHRTGFVYEHPETVIEMLAGTSKLADIVPLLQRADIPASAFPALRQCWEDHGSPAMARSLFVCIGKTGAPEALEFLTAALGGEPPVVAAAIIGLDAYADEHDNPALRDALHRAIRTAGAKADSNLLVSRLIKLGDPKIIGELPGLVKARRWTNLQVLDDRWDDARDVRAPRHGYDAAALAAAWDLLLDGDDVFWRPDLLFGGGYQGVGAPGLGSRKSRKDRPRPEVVRVLLAKLKRMVAQGSSSGTAPSRVRMHMLRALLELPDTWVTPVPASVAAIHALGVDCLASPVADLRQAALGVLLQRRPSPAQRPHVLRLAAGSAPASDAAFEVLLAHERLTEAEIADLFQAASPRIRFRILAAYLTKWPVALPVATVLPALEDDAEYIRRHACAYLGKLCDAAAVPALLKVLRDPDPEVRAAAQDALRAIRFYHEQKAHWDRVFEGPTVSGNDAAEALLKQASPDEKKDVRLIALRSLGLLGKVETVPFLIRYSKETDAEIAAAAREAIDEVLRRAAAAK